MVIAALWGVLALLVTAVLAVALAGRRSATAAVYGPTAAIAALLALIGLAALLGFAEGGSIRLPIGLPLTGAHFAIDAISAVFLVIVGTGGTLASLYELGHGRHEEAPGRVLPFYPAFIAGMTLVLLAADAFSFLLSWEFMSLSSFALVLAHHRDADNRHAAYVYILMASFGTLALILAMGLLAGPGGVYDFAGMRAVPRDALVQASILVLAILGAGSKAGLVPLHIWLPLAHPAAPSHVSALMSGVMTKVAVYGFVRIVLDLAGPSPWQAAVAVIAIGSVTAVVGVMHALMERDLKRLLAYSTVENLGIIFIGIGLAMAFRANGMASAAALALTASLLHALNHSLFKTLLFLGAGAVLSATGVRDLERLGGLIHRMPVTALMFLVGALAIAALPPLNGFVSEWLMFQAILISPNLSEWGLKLSVPAAGAMLALAAALSAATMIRCFGIAFLGRPRSLEATGAHEADRLSLAAMSLLAFSCVLAGVLPGLLIDALAPAVRAITGASMPQQGDLAWMTIVPIAESRSSYSGLLVLGFVVMSALLAAETVHRLASRRLRRAPAWDCGFPDPSPVTQYTAESFAQPARRVFGEVFFRARERVTMPRPGDPSPARLEVERHDVIVEGLYLPIAGLVEGAAGRLNALQFLSIRRYLTLVFALLVALLLMVALWP
ncbi:MAG: hydrogenase 4 subunit B [Hyphomicrobiaceae bacterium]